MRSEYPNAPMPPNGQKEMQLPSSRLTDEKISDDTGTETQTKSALAPAGLKNPFWK